MKYPIFRYDLNKQLPVSNIFKSDLIGEKHDVSVYILSPSLNCYKKKISI